MCRRSTLLSFVTSLSGGQDSLPTSTRTTDYSHEDSQKENNQRLPRSRQMFHQKQRILRARTVHRNTNTMQTTNQLIQRLSAQQERSYSNLWRHHASLRPQKRLPRNTNVTRRLTQQWGISLRPQRSRHQNRRYTNRITNRGQETMLTVHQHFIIRRRSRHTAERTLRGQLPKLLHQPSNRMFQTWR